MTVRFRIDGVLREVLQSKRAVAPLVVSRIKVMSKLDIAEKRLPQDGRISLRIAGRAVDVRVSTIPSGHGERVVLRLLDKQAGPPHARRTSACPTRSDAMDELVHRPHGILLVTGPDRLGQDDDALRRARAHQRPHAQHPDRRGPDRVPDRRHRPDAGQHEGRDDVRARPARDPAPGPRRRDGRRDPRPRDGARSPCRRSLTGHLVLSTLHTNTAVGAVTRLRDMGVEPFLLSSSLIGVLAQRLVRVLDPANCACRIAAGEYECRLLGRRTRRPADAVPRAGTDVNGYRGRTGIYELVKVDNTMRTMIHDGAGRARSRALRAHADSEHPRRRHAKVLAGNDDARRGPPSHARG